MAFRVRDPIHNFVLLPDELQPVVDSAALQRLRGIRQLALASLVYPGAIHTRFDHTLGVANVAGMMAEALISRPMKNDWSRLPVYSTTSVMGLSVTFPKIHCSVSQIKRRSNLTRGTRFMRSSPPRSFATIPNFAKS